MKLSEDEQKLVDRAKEQLLEHFDSVHVFVTKHNGEDDTTAAYETGGGNFYARLGQMHEWISIQDQYQRNWAIKNDNSRED